MFGRARENERASAGALHAVQEATALPPREPVQRERRTKDVAKELLSALVIVGVDVHAGVEREAVEHGAVALVRKRDRQALSAVDLGRLQLGERVLAILGIRVAGGDHLGGSPDDPPQDSIDLLVRGRR